MPAEVILQTNGLSKRYGKRWVVNDVNLCVRRGEIFGFLGPNGAGKSTTIRMLLSLVRPTRGRVELFGKPLERARKEVLSRVGGLVERADFYLYLSGRKNLEIVSAMKGEVSAKAIDEVLEIVGLGTRAGDKVKTYSHGMKQRLGIAQALLGSPEFIVLDEPTTGLDPQGIKEVRELIRTLTVEKAITVFLSSHLLSEIEQTASSMAIINAGSLVVQGNVQDLMSAGQNVVKIDAEPAERACTLIREQFPGAALKSDGTSIEVAIPRDKVGRLNTDLVQAGITVRALVPKRSLEEYFLAITEGASDVGTPLPRRP